MSNNTDINPLDHPVDSYETALMGGLFTLGSVLVPFVCRTLLESTGRKNTTLLLSILMMAAMIMMAFATNIIWILVARLVVGTCSIGHTIATPIFLSEISCDHTRGKIVCLVFLFNPLGQLFGYIAGPPFSVKYFTLLCTAPLIMHIFFMLFVSESPIHLFNKGRRDSAVKTLIKYKAKLSRQEISKEVHLMAGTFEQSKKGNNMGMKFLITDQQTRRGFLVGMGLTCFQAGSGIDLLLAFMGPIFEEADTVLSGDTTAILVGVLKVSVYFIVAQIVEKIGKRPLMIFSCFLCSISLLVLGSYFFMKENLFSSYENYSWVPLASILLYIFAYSLGLGPIPQAAIGEMFNNNVRSLGVSISVFISRMVCTILLSCYPLVVGFIGNSGSMWIFSVICALGAIFCFFGMPETKGKSFYEIQEMLECKR